ncbi:MAG: 16S rRNA (adenine(1518)-N(6)/adenine(1519)-N(6))-dimethyltransferase RsmA [Thermoplasmata archaeon]
MSRTSTASSSPRKRDGLAVPGAIPERPGEVQAALAALGIVPSKVLGQSFLVDPFVADAEAALADDPAGRPVVEIGGGLGILTAALVRRGIADLTVIERDRRLAHHLRSAFGSRITVREADALDLEVPADAVVVGNLPFSSATPILLRLFARRVPRVVALVQKEVAARLAAGPGSRTYGRLSIAARLYGEVELFQEVPESSFYPPPAVRGQIFVHTTRDGALPVPSVERFEAVVRTLFSSRRKQLGNLLPQVAGGHAEAEALAREADWPPDWARRRPEELPPEAFFRLASVMSGAAKGPAR